VTGVADEHHIAALTRVARDFHVHPWSPADRWHRTP
jgi:hypothetical protein